MHLVKNVPSLILAFNLTLPWIPSTRCRVRSELTHSLESRCAKKFTLLCLIYRLEIIEKPENDPQWWKARSERGKVGLVPRNYVQVLSQTAPVVTEDFSDKYVWWVTKLYSSSPHNLSLPWLTKYAVKKLLNLLYSTLCPLQSITVREANFNFFANALHWCGVVTVCSRSFFIVPAVLVVSAK